MNALTSITPLYGKASVEFVRGTDEDKEFYPTTDEIIEAVKQDINDVYGKLSGKSILDAGAGDGRVLTGVCSELIEKDNCDTRHKFHSSLSYYKQPTRLLGIEQSEKLISLWHKDIIPVGSDFFDTNLMAVDAQITYSNPPFTQIEPWLTKLISETRSEHCYIVSPQRWRDSAMIEDALNKRGGKVVSLGLFSFLDGDRAVREGRDEVELFRVDFGSVESDGFVSPMKVWLKEMFGESVLNEMSKERESIQQRFNKFNEQSSSESVSKGALVSGEDYVTALTEMYQKEQNNIFDAMKKFQSIDTSLFAAIGVSVSDAIHKMQKELTTLRVEYWREFFANTKELSGVVDSKTLYTFQCLVGSYSSAEFTTTNIRMVMMWILKNIKEYNSIQMGSNIDSLLNSVNIESYKSNEARFVRGEWEYASQIPNDLTHFYLNTTKRMIISAHKGRVNKEPVCSKGELHYNIKNNLNDICVMANNAGFPVQNMSILGDTEWTTGAKRDITFIDRVSGKLKALGRIKVFKSGTVHINFDKDFITYINIEFGKRNGWVTSPQQAADEMGISLEAAQLAFTATDNAVNLPLSSFIKDEPIQIGTP